MRAAECSVQSTEIRRSRRNLDPSGLARAGGEVWVVGVSVVLGSGQCPGGYSLRDACEERAACGARCSSSHSRGFEQLIVVESENAGREWHGNIEQRTY